VEIGYLVNVEGPAGPVQQALQGEREVVHVQAVSNRVLLRVQFDASTQLARGCDDAKRHLTFGVVIRVGSSVQRFDEADEYLALRRWSGTKTAREVFDLREQIAAKPHPCRLQLL
jgi:hypothetical protein